MYALMAVARIAKAAADPVKPAGQPDSETAFGAAIETACAAARRDDAPESDGQTSAPAPDQKDDGDDSCAVAAAAGQVLSAVPFPAEDSPAEEDRPRRACGGKDALANLSAPATRTGASAQTDAVPGGDAGAPETSASAGQAAQPVGMRAETGLREAVHASGEAEETGGGSVRAAAAGMETIVREAVRASTAAVKAGTVEITGASAEAEKTKIGAAARASATGAETVSREAVRASATASDDGEAMRGFAGATQSGRQEDEQVSEAAAASVAREAARADGSDDAQSRHFDRRVRAASVPAQAQATRGEAARGAETQPQTVEAAVLRGGTKADAASVETAEQSGDEKPRTGDVSGAEAVAAPAQQNGEAREAARAQSAAGAQSAERTESASAQLAHSTTRALARGENTFQLRLRPEGMGEVSVTIHAREHDLSLSIRASSETTRTLILSQIDDLRSGLATGDYRLGALNVEVNANGYGGAGSEAASQEREGGGQRRASGKTRRQTADAAPDRPLQARAGAIMYRI